MAEPREQQKRQENDQRHYGANINHDKIVPPTSNYTLSTVCPACNAPTHRRACKVRCDRCGFMWDCSEL